MARRAEWWTADLLDASDNRLGRLLRIRGGSLEWSIFRSVKGSGSLELTADPSAAIQSSWLGADRVRIEHHAGDPDGDYATRPFGIWIATRPSREYDGAVERSTLALVDKTHLLNQPTGRWATYPAGTPVVSTVRGIIASRGVGPAVIEDSGETLRAPLNFDPSDVTWLQICNDLLRAIGYDSLTANMDGSLISGPYVPPDDRELMETYGAGAGLMVPRWTDDADASDMPNVVHVYAPGDDLTPGLVGSASNDNPLDPLSTFNRGEIVAPVEQVEATSQAAIDAIARQRLAELSQVTRRATITHPVDHVQLGDLVRHSPGGFSGAVVQRSVDLGIGAVVSDTIRRIYTGGDLPWT